MVSRLTSPSRKKSNTTSGSRRTKASGQRPEVRPTKSSNNTQYLSSPRIGVQMREFALLEGAETYRLGLVSPEFDGLVQHVASSYPMIFYNLSKENQDLVVDRFIRQVNQHYRQNEGRKAKRADIADHIGGFRTKDEVRQHYIDFEILELPILFAMDLPS